MFNIYVGNLPSDSTEEEFRGVFEQFGNVVSVKILYQDDADVSFTKCAFVSFETQSAADAALDAFPGRSFLMNS